MLVTIFEVVLVLVGLALVVLGMYGIVRGKWGEQTPFTAAGITINASQSVLMVILGLGSLGLSVYLSATETTNNAVATPISSANSSTSSSPSPVSITARPSSSASSTISVVPPTNTISPVGTLLVTVDTPKTGAPESRAGSFTVGGRVLSSLGSDKIWIVDYDTTGYTIDEQATISSGRWSATDGPPLGTSNDALPYQLTVGVVLANPSCANRLNQLSNSNQSDIRSLPSGCELTGEKVTVNVSQP